MKKTKLSLLLIVAISSSTFASINLDKITVTTPTKSNQSLANTTANVAVITADEIQMRGYTTVQKALSAIAGINLSKNGGLGQSSSIKLRGFDSKRVLVLIDGVRYNDPSSISGAPFEHLLTQNIEQIEVVKGAGSGIWGADASAGVINIITKKATKDGFKALITGEYGTYNTQKYGLNTGYKQDKFDISLNAGRVSTDGFSAQVPAGANVGDFEDDSYENNTIDIKTGVNITNKDRVEAFFNYIDTKTDYDGYDVNFMPDFNDPKSKANSKEQFFGASYVRSEGENHTKIYVNRSKFKRHYPNDFIKHYDGSVDEVGLNSSIKYIKEGSLSGGVDYKKFKHDNEISKDYSNQGAFLTNSNKFNEEQTIFSQSIRYDKFDSFNNKLTYKIGLKHISKNIKDLWTSFNYATAYNVPSLYQLYSSFGNQNLNPEETKGFDVTLNYKGIGITYFHNNIDDIIDYDFATSKYANIKGKSKLSGVELSLKNSIEAIGLAYGVNYTYLKAKDKDGKKLIRRPENSANLSLDYYALTNAHFGTLIQYVGKRDDTGDKKLSSYTLVDFIADYDVTSQINVYFKIDNVLDKKYQEITGYGTSERAFYLGFRYNIK